VTEVRLTPKGRKAIAAALPLWQQVQSEIAERLGAGRVEQMREFAAAAVALNAQTARASARRR
jgi:DNA-binding MarR family transcriptional regulator